MKEPWKSEPTARGYWLLAELTTWSVIVTLQAKRLGREGEGEAAEVRWFEANIAKVVIHFPADVAAMHGAIAHWCDYYDPELRSLVPKLLEPLSTLSQLAPSGLPQQGGGMGPAN